MASAAVYLISPGTTEESFAFYKSVFQTEFTGEIGRFGDIPMPPEMEPISPEAARRIMKIELPITGGLRLMGADCPIEWESGLIKGNTVNILISPDDNAEADRLYEALAEGGTREMEMSESFGGSYYGSLVDKYGVNWMIGTVSLP